VQYALDVIANYHNVLRHIPSTLWGGIAARTNTIDLASFIQRAIRETPAGATLYFPMGTYLIESGISHDNSIVIVGDPAQENFDDSWDYGASGTVLHYRGTTGDAFTFAPPDTGDRRINVILHHLTFRSSRVTDSGTSGSCVVVNGRNQPETYVRLDLEDAHFCEAPHHGISILGNVYGGDLNNISAYRNGHNGVRAVGSGRGDFTGEMVLGRIRCFQNGQNARGTQQEKANFLWLGGALFINMLSASESGYGPGAIFGGGPINIGHFQAESNHNDDSLIIGQNEVSVRAMKIGTYMIAPGADYRHSHIYLTQHTAGRIVIGPGYHADTLGAGGLHLKRDNGAGELSWDITPDSFADTPTIDDNAGSFNTRFPLYVLARDTAGLADATGDGTEVIWKPDTEILDAWAAYDHLNGMFTAPISGLYEFEPIIPLASIETGHDRVNLNINATNFARAFREGSAEGQASALGHLTLARKVVIPMLQGDTASVTFAVIGGAKTIDTIADPSHATLSIRSVG